MEVVNNKETGKLSRPITAKRWVFSFVGMIVFVMLAIAAVNYIVDPFSYFHPLVVKDRGLYSYDGSCNYRLVHYNYFKEHHQEYTGVILGGSKGLFIEESYINKVSGEKYCQLSATYGNFHDYLDWVRWIAENTNIRHIFLNVSTLEVCWYTPEERGEEETGCIEPAALDQDKSALVEFVKYLYRGGLEPSLKYLQAKRDGTLTWINVATAITPAPIRNSDPWSYYAGWITDVNQRLEYSANGEYSLMPAISRNLEAMQEIKEICEASGIELSVAIAPTSTWQYLLFESPEYWNYLKNMAQIIDYWDFSVQSSISKNIFNFFDKSHMLSEALRPMLDQIYGITPGDGYGVYVTAENVEEHIAERQRCYNELMEEYAETGTVWQGMYYDDGYVMNELFDPVMSSQWNERVHNLSLKDHLNITQYFYATFDYLEGIGIFAGGVPARTEDLGNLKLSVYDVTGRHTLFSGDVDLSGIQNGREYYIHLDGLELIEGHWYSLIFSYESKVENDRFSLQCVDGEPTPNMYAELDAVSQTYEVRMDLFRRQSYGNCRQKDAVLRSDRMRGEGEGETQEITEQTLYTQYFTADCDLLSFIQLGISHRNDTEASAQKDSDYDYNIILELRDSGGEIIGRKTILGATLLTAMWYNIEFNVPVQSGETYELTVYANKTAEQGLQLLTHGAERDSALFLNGMRTGESLSYRIYGV